MTNPLRFPFTRAPEPEPAPPRAHFPLSRAMACCDCDSCFEMVGEQVCPACGSRQAVALGRSLSVGRAG